MYHVFDSVLLQAFEGTNKRTPVWFMRQAGRFLPEYRQLREAHSLDELFNTPELAAEVTCLPVRRLEVDAAILFADILTLPGHMGFTVSFSAKGTGGEAAGPVIANPITVPLDVERMRYIKDLPALTETIRLVNQKLPKGIPLLGFAGAPFTVLTYLIEGGSSTNFRKTFAFARQCPHVFRKALEILTDNTIAYLNIQKEAGIKAFQLFDTWGGMLSVADYRQWAYPFAKKIFESVQLPSIYYVKNCCHLLKLMEQTGAQFLSPCHTIDLADPNVLQHSPCGIQGNLNNTLVYADYEELRQEVLKLLTASKRFKRYIFNLSHGLLPDTDVEKVKFIIQTVHAFHR